MAVEGEPMMKKSRLSDYVLVIMKKLNLLTIAYTSVIIAYCLSGYIRENAALELMQKIDTMPIAAWKIPVVAITLYIALLLLLYIQNTNSTALFLKIFLELAVSFAISYVIGFSYTGIILLVLADALRYFPNFKRKVPFVIIVCIIYLLIDYDLISTYCRITALEPIWNIFKVTRGRCCWETKMC